MRFLFSLLLLALLAHVQSITAQQRPDWIRIAPVDERFEILFPLQPHVETTEVSYDSGSGPISASGNLYSSSSEAATYMIWSLETSRTPRNQPDEIGVFLDRNADLVWESLLKPTREASPLLGARMSYKSEVSLGMIPGREYGLRIGDAVGVTRFYINAAHLYVLVALGSSENLVDARNFFEGFLAKAPTDTAFAAVPVPMETEPYDQVFNPSETTTRAKVISKPEPQYTEAARKYGVKGMVALSGIISPDGRVIDIHVVKRLPHGLTEATIAAAQRIRFTPATKNGQPVFQSLKLEYSFDLY